MLSTICSLLRWAVHHSSTIRLVWDYKKADPNNIKKALELVNWERLFDQKSIDARVATFNDTTLLSLILYPISISGSCMDE